MAESADRGCIENYEEETSVSVSLGLANRLLDNRKFCVSRRICSVYRVQHDAPDSPEATQCNGNAVPSEKKSELHSYTACVVVM